MLLAILFEARNFDLLSGVKSAVISLRILLIIMLLAILFYYNLRILLHFPSMAFCFIFVSSYLLKGICSLFSTDCTVEHILLLVMFHFSFCILHFSGLYFLDDAVI